MSVFTTRHEIHEILDSLPPEALPDLLDYLDYLRYRSQRQTLSTRAREAIRLYVTEEVSLGRAAELAGMNYFQFEELVQKQGIAVVEPEASRAGIVRQQELVDAVLA